MENPITFFKALQHELQTQEHDCQAEPRFWVIMDYKKEPGHEDYHQGDTVYYHNDGEITEFENVQDLKEFLIEYEYDENDPVLASLLKDDTLTFDTLWSYITEIDEHFNDCFMQEVRFIVPNTLFITKNDAKQHLQKNRHHYTSKAHTYAMTALRSPSVENLWRILEHTNWDEYTS